MSNQSPQSTAPFPPDFSLEKYSAVSSFTIVDWAVNLKRRSYCRFLLGENWEEPTPLFNALFPNHKEELRRQATSFSENLIAFPVESTEGLQSNFWGGSEGKHVTDFTMNDYCIYATDLEKEDDDPPNELERYVQIYRKNELEHDERSIELQKPLWKAFQETGLYAEPRVLVKIDLEGAEEAIISDFVVWLKETRQAFSLHTPRTPGKLPSDQELQEWTQMMILPYLDLTLWAQAHGVEITQHAIGSALFPDEYDVNLAERIRKVTKPRALKVSTESYVRALLSLAAASLAEPKN